MLAILLMISRLNSIDQKEICSSKVGHRGGKLVNKLLQIPNNFHLYLTWGRWSLTLIDALELVSKSHTTP